MNFLSGFVILVHFIGATLTNRGIFTEGLVGQPVNLAPHISRQNQLDKDISQLLYPQLVQYNTRGDLVPNLAESWEVSSNFMEYDLKLKEGVYWSNGREVVSDDVIFTAQNAAAIKNVEVQKINEHEVKFFLKEPFAPFLDTLTLKIIPREARVGFKPVTLANHRVVRVVKSGQRVDEILVHVDNPEAASSGGIEFVKFKFYDTQEDLETAAKLCEVDALYSPNLENRSFFKFDFPLKARRYGAFFNLNADKLSDTNLRRDMASVVDRSELISEALRGLGEPLNFLGIGPSQNTTAKYSESVVLTVPNEEEHLKIAALLKKSWEALGLTVQVLPLPFWDISTRVIDTKDFEVLLFGQEKGRDPDEYTLWHSSKTHYPGLNISQLNNQRVDDALEKGRRETDPEKREGHYENFRVILKEEVPVVFLYRPVYRWYISEKYQSLFERYLLATTCCDGCECKEPQAPSLYYPQERLTLLPI
jgi:peptide/nickel transport system substrate-binding protein